MVAVQYALQIVFTNPYASTPSLFVIYGVKLKLIKKLNIVAIPDVKIVISILFTLSILSPNKTNLPVFLRTSVYYSAIISTPMLQ